MGSVSAPGPDGGPKAPVLVWLGVVRDCGMAAILCRHRQRRTSVIMIEGDNTARNPLAPRDRGAAWILVLMMIMSAISAEWLD